MKTLTVEDVSEMLSWHPDTVRRKACAGELPAAKVGKRFIFLETDLIQWLRSRYAKPANSEKVICLSGKEMASGTSTLLPRMDSAYADRLGLRAREKRKGSTTNSKQGSGKKRS